LIINVAGQMVFRGISFSTFYVALNANKKYFYEKSLLSYNQMLVLTGAMTGGIIAFVEVTLNMINLHNLTFEWLKIDSY